MDGGNSWTDRTPVTSAPLSSISCPITTMCIAVGMAGTILQTWNNGLRWDARASGTGEDLGTIRCPTTYHCYVTAGAGIILATDSAGNIWTSHDTGIPPEGWLAGLSCPSVLTCYATGYKGLITATTNGGTSWTLQASPATRHLLAIDCATEGDCIAGGDSGTLVARSNGSAWFASSHGSGVWLHGISCVGSTCMAAGDGGTVLISANRGESWSENASGVSPPLLGISCASETVCIAVGDQGTIASTADGGSNWSHTQVGNQAFRGISCPTVTVCLAVGDFDILTTADGGAHWTSHGNPYAFLYGVSCADSSNCWVVGDSGTIVAVTLAPQFGETLQDSSTSMPFRAVDCPLWPTCYASGYGNVYSTTDGASWHHDAMPLAYSSNLYGISCASSTICVAAGDGGVISTQDGSTWSLEQSGVGGLKAASCRSVCLVAGDYGAILSPNAPPDPPANVVAIAGDGTADVYWSESMAGNVPVTSYSVTPTIDGVPLAPTTISGSPPPTHARITGLTPGVGYRFTVSALNIIGPSATSAPSDVAVPGRGQFHPLPPARILDTRNGTGGVPQRKLRPLDTLTVPVTGIGGVPPSGVAAVVLNVTVTNTTTPGYLTVYPNGVPHPLASNLNWVAGQTVPNLVEVAVGTSGAVTVFNPAGSTDVIFDVAGYVATPAEPPGADGLFTPVVPKRVLDTRDGTGEVSNRPVGPGQTISIRVAGTPNIPSTGVGAVVLNVTVTGATQPSYLTVFPAGTTRPNASNLNFVGGQTVPNRVIVKVGDLNGTAGWVSFFNRAGSTQVIADVGGWFTDNGNAAATGSRFVGMTPTRILDTRDGTGGFTAPLGPGGSIALPVAGRAGVPVGATAVVANVTVTDTTTASYLTAWPDGDTRPNASDLNWVAGRTVPNLVIVKLGSNGKLDLFNAAGSTNIVVDVVGYYR